MRIVACGSAILALIQEETRLLPASQVDLQMSGAFPDPHSIRDLTVQHVDAPLQPLEHAHSPVIARQDGGWSEHLHEQLGDLVATSIHPLGERLHDQILSVPIDDQRRQSVGLGVHQPVGVSIDLERLAVRDRGLQSISPQLQTWARPTVTEPS